MVQLSYVPRQIRSAHGSRSNADGRQQIFYLLKIFKINLSIFLPDDLSVGPWLREDDASSLHEVFPDDKEFAVAGSRTRGKRLLADLGQTRKLSWGEVEGKKPYEAKPSQYATRCNFFAMRDVIYII